MKHKVLRKQHISKMCFVCGERNDFGLHARFFETDDQWFIKESTDDPSEIEIP